MYIICKRNMYWLYGDSGKAERETFEKYRPEFSKKVPKIYDEATTYHDGKWIMFMPQDASMFTDFMKLLEIKRRPKRKKVQE